jgi:hypothetical protein
MEYAFSRVVHTLHLLVSSVNLRTKYRFIRQNLGERMLRKQGGDNDPCG